MSRMFYTTHRKGGEGTGKGSEITHPIPLSLLLFETNDDEKEVSIITYSPTGADNFCSSTINSTDGRHLSPNSCEHVSAGFQLNSVGCRRGTSGDHQPTPPLTVTHDQY